jgi:putative transposase
MIHELQAEDVRQAVVRMLSEHIPIKTEGYQINTEMSWQTMIKAAVDQSSLEATSQDLAGVVHGNTLREHLQEVFDVSQLREQALHQNAVLAASLPRELWGKAVDVAIDFHDEPFYGKSGEARLYVCRGKAEKGTTYFWRIATAYVLADHIGIDVCVA